MSLRTALLSAGLIFAATSVTATAQDTDSIIRALASVADNLQKASDEKWPLVMKCVDGDGNTYEVGRVLILPTITYDVQVTNSLVNPYLGLVRFLGQVATNRYSHRANGFLSAKPGAFDETKKPTCFKTPEEALAASSEGDFTYRGGDEVLGSYTLNSSGTVWQAKEGNYDFNKIVYWAGQFPNSQQWYPVLVSPVTK